MASLKTTYALAFTMFIQFWQLESSHIPAQIQPLCLRQSGQRIYLVLRRETPVGIISGFRLQPIPKSERIGRWIFRNQDGKEKKHLKSSHLIRPTLNQKTLPGTLQWGAGISFQVVPKPPCSASGKKRWRFHPVPCVSCMSGWYLHTPSKNHVPLPKSSQFF